MTGSLPGLRDTGRCSYIHYSYVNTGNYYISTLQESQEPGPGRDHHAERHSAGSGKEKGQTGPFHTAGLFSYGHQSGGTGPVKEEKYHGTQCCNPGPVLGNQKRFKVCQTARIHKSSLGRIGHDDDGDHDFIGRQPQDKGHKDHAVHAKKPPKRIQTSADMAQKAYIIDGNICQNPDHQTCGSGDGGGPP